MDRRWITWVGVLTGVLLLTGCMVDNAEVENLNARLETVAFEMTALNEEIQTLKAANASLEASGEALRGQLTRLEALEEDPVVAARNLLAMIGEKDWTALSSRVHPDRGLRLSPYSRVEVDQDLVFTAEDVLEFDAMTSPMTWGFYDGTGEPIVLDFPAYYGRFLFDQDYRIAPIMGLDTEVSTGNLISNIENVYPEAVFMEFHFPGIDPAYMGMDWRSLTLVMEMVDGTYYLVGIVHGEWTI